jgi:transposase
MAQYIINARHCSVFGMDVHARSVSVRGIDRSTGETKLRRFGDCPSAGDIAAWMGEHFTGPHYAAYESGCTGFQLCRDLRAQGIDCDVVAVTSIARSTDDRQRKTDKMDAKRLLAELLLPEPTHTTVWVPDTECEAARDLARARADAVLAAKRSKQQTSALLLRHGYVWNDKTVSGNRKKTWGREYWAWIDRIDLGEPCANEALECYMRTVKECDRQVAELSALVEGHALSVRFKPYVDALCLLKGIDVQTAFLLAAEFGDFSRFKNGRSVSKWLGTVPSESSSAEHVAHGRITKAGDVHCRTALVEGAATISRRDTNPKKARKGCVVSPDTAALCAEANRRLKKRYDHLVNESKIHANKAKIAVVSELARWVWAVGLKVHQEQQALQG